MKQVTQAAVPMELSCVSYKAATFTLLAVLLLFLPFVVSGLLKCYKKKLRQSKRSRSQRMVAIGRRKNNKVGKDGRTQSSNGPNLQSLHDYKFCPVLVPAIEITHENRDAETESTREVAYAQIGSCAPTPNQNANLPNVNLSKPSSNFVVVDENTNAKQFTKTSTTCLPVLNINNFASSTPACGDYQQGACPAGFQKCESIYISPVTHRKDQRNDVIHTKDQRNDVIKTLPSESEASDVFTPCDRTDRKFSLTSVFRIVPNRIRSTLASLTTAHHVVTPGSMTPSTSNDALYLTFKDGTPGDSSLKR